MLKKKKHEYDEYFYGLVLSKSKSLLKFVNEHKAGSDYARKKIIDAKYNISKLEPILHGFFLRVLHKPHSFTIDRSTYLTNSRDIGIELEISDDYHPYGSVQYKIEDKIITIENGKFRLTNDATNRDIFNSVFKAVMVQLENASVIDFNVQKRKQHEKYLKQYGSEYP